MGEKVLAFVSLEHYHPWRIRYGLDTSQDEPGLLYKIRDMRHYFISPVGWDGCVFGGDDPSRDFREPRAKGVANWQCYDAGTGKLRWSAPTLPPPDRLPKGSPPAEVGSAMQPLLVADGKLLLAASFGKDKGLAVIEIRRDGFRPLGRATNRQLFPDGSGSVGGGFYPPVLSNGRLFIRGRVGRSQKVLICLDVQAR